MSVLETKKFVASLHRHNVQFILVGGLAAIGHGMNYNTNDVDICYQRKTENYSKIITALKDSHPLLRTVSGSVPFLFDEKTLKNGLNFTFETDWGPIDLLGEVSGVGRYEQIIQNATKMDFYGINIDTISLDDLIKAKKAANRTKDQLHLMQLEAIREILKANEKTNS